MAHRVCPWWLGYVLASPLRRLLQDPHEIVAPFVSEGMTVVEPGPGMGFFTLELARLVGESGKVVAVDVQPRMLKELRRRASKAGLLGRVDARIATAGSLGIDDLAGSADFALAFAVVHEIPDQRRFFSELAAALRPGGKVLLVEPSGHVGERELQATLRTAAEAGLRAGPGPRFARSRSAVLVKP